MKASVASPAQTKSRQSVATAINQARANVTAPPFNRSREPHGGEINADREYNLFNHGQPAVLQTKAAVGEDDDALEREADNVADAIVAAPAGTRFDNSPRATSPPATSEMGLQRKCAECGQCDECKRKGVIQKKSSSAPSPYSAPSQIHDVLRSPGRPLDAGLRGAMERSFGHDFSRVRVHTGAAADASARGIGAHAFTAGHNIVFADGQYAPSQTSGRRLIAHELTHVLQQSHGGNPGTVVQRKGAKVAGCGLLNLAGSITGIGSAAHIQIQAYLAAKGIAAEFPIPRATKLNLGWGCRSAATPWGYADLARRAGPGFDLAEIKPISMGGRVRAKLEVGHYRRRATQSMQRLFKIGGACARRPAGLDDNFFASVNSLTPISGFSLLSGALSGDETIGPFVGDPSLTLKAKEISAGAVCYWCTKDKSQKQPAKPPGPNVGLGISVGGSSGGAYNAGVGVAIMSDSTAYGTAGAGVSYKSDSKAAGAAGVGASAESDSLAAGAAGAGASKDTQSIGAGAAGAGASSGSVSAAAGAAAAGTSQDSATAGAGVAGKGSVKDSAIAGAGASGSGRIEGVEGAGTGSPGKRVDIKDAQGGGKSVTPIPPGAEGKASDRPQADQGKTAEQSAAGKGDQAGTGTSDKSGAQGGGGSKKGTGEEAGSADAPAAGTASGKGGSESAAAKGAQGANEAGQDPSAGSDTGTGSSTSAGPDGRKDAAGGGTSKVAGGLGVGPIVGPAASEADRQRAAAEATKVAALLAGASPAQIALFRHLAASSADGRYVVPASQWVDTMMRATQGLSEEDIKYLHSLNWTPAKITAQELRRKILERLKTKKPPVSADSAKDGTSDTAKAKAKAKGKGHAGKGTAGTGAKRSHGGDTATRHDRAKDGPNLSGFVQPRKYTGNVTTFDNAGFEIQPDNKQITLKTTKGSKVTLEVRWIEGDVVRRAMVEYEIIADPVMDTDPNSNIKFWRFDMKSTNTDPLIVSPEGTDKPAIVPPHAPASYYMFKK
jgi:hypothetical protein